MAEPKGLTGLVQEIFSDIKTVEKKREQIKLDWNQTGSEWEFHRILDERKSLCFMLKKVLEYGGREIPEELINEISAWCLEKVPSGDFIKKAAHQEYFYLACDLTRTYSTSAALKDEIFQHILASNIPHEAELATVLAKEFYDRSLNDEEILRLVNNYTHGGMSSTENIRWYEKMARIYGSEACQSKVLVLLDEMRQPHFD